jgi:hypothetical protein
MARSWKAISSPFRRDPARLVTRCRSRTVAKGNSNTLAVRRWSQCVARKPKKASNSASTRRSEDTPFGYLAP